MNNLAERLKFVQNRIETNSLSSGYNKPLLLAVSKSRTEEEIRTLVSLGIHDFGENYLQEALTKIEGLKNKHLVWHFIGPLQSNKTRPVAANFDWVHSVDSLKLARRLSEQRPSHLPPLNICLQINISQENTKSGILPEDALELSRAIVHLPNTILRGLMAIPEKSNTEKEQRRPFKNLHDLATMLIRNGVSSIDTLSMGMSNDLEAAILEGATIVRIGTALFGPRPEKQT